MRQQLWSIQNSFPVEPKKTYDQNLPITINRFVESHHFEGWIRLEDIIHLEEKEQYLKRFYQKQEFPNKIKMLGDYYRFHFYAPRIFIPDVARIVEQNVEDKREIEYMIVTKQMQKNKQNQIQDEKRYVKKSEKYQKLIKDVQLSYHDFQTKEPRKLPFKKINSSKHNLHQNKQKVPQTLSRVDSLKFKGSYLVFKPRKSQIKTKQLQEKPKTFRKQEKQEKNLKATITKKNNVVNKKTSSKTTSVCNSIVSQSHQGLSRSKSRPQLTVLSGNKLQQKKILLKQHNMTSRNNSRSNMPSVPNSLTKNSNKREKTGENQGKTKVLSRNGSKAQIKQMNHQQFNSHKQVGDKIGNENKGCLSRKNSQCQLETKKKRMFTKALDIKKKK